MWQLRQRSKCTYVSMACILIYSNTQYNKFNLIDYSLSLGQFQKVMELLEFLLENSLRSWEIAIEYNWYSIMAWKNS